MENFIFCAISITSSFKGYAYSAVGFTQTLVPMIFLTGLYLLFYSIDFNKSHCVKCPYSKFFKSLFSPIQTEYKELKSKSPYPV